VEHHGVVCKKLSGCLRQILCQALVPGVNGDLVLATELLVNNYAVQSIVREGRFEQIKTCLETGKFAGMHTMVNSLKRLEEQGVVSAQSISDCISPAA